MHSVIENRISNSKYADVPRAFSKVGLFFVLLVFVYLLVFNVQIYLRNRDLLGDEHKLQRKLVREREQNKILRKRLILISDLDNIETMARDKLGYVMAGETAYRIY